MRACGRLVAVRGVRPMIAGMRVLGDSFMRAWVSGWTDGQDSDDRTVALMAWFLAGRENRRTGELVTGHPENAIRCQR